MVVVVVVVTGVVWIMLFVGLGEFDIMVYGVLWYTMLFVVDKVGMFWVIFVVVIGVLWNTGFSVVIWVFWITFVVVCSIGTPDI